VIVVSPDANDYLEANKLESGDSQVIPFTARLHQEAERARLFAFLHAENYKLTQVIHNQPFLFKPVEKEKQLNLDSESVREQQRVQQRVEELKEKVRILVETPLFLNADLLKQALIEDNARIL
jgi:hypothetical protein